MARVKTPGVVSDLKGASRAVVDAVAGITDVVETLHGTISRLSPVFGRAAAARGRGVTGLVYRSIRGVTQTVGIGIDAILTQLPLPASDSGPTPRRDAAVAALNGVFGDYLAASDNPLAINMQLRVGGRAVTMARSALAAAFPDASQKLTVLVHGLCMNDLQWRHDGHDHGETLTRDLGHSCVYLYYNSGRRIPHNGREFSMILESLLDAWPVPVKELAIVGHSMGGLVARSAGHYAAEARHRWPRKLTKLICLGTPHLGARLERAGSWIDMLLGVSPYSAPLARLGLARSAGIKDLRHGTIVDIPDIDRADGIGSTGHTGHTGSTGNTGSTGSTGVRATRPSRTRSGARSAAASSKCHVIAGTTKAAPSTFGKRLVGDGLVSVASALGQGNDGKSSLPIPSSRRFIAYGTNHLELLSSPQVCDRLCSWLDQRATRKPRLLDALSGELKPRAETR